MILKKIWGLFSQKQRDRNLAALKSTLASYTPTRDLLKLAEEKGIEIKFSKFSFFPNEKGSYRSKNNTIFLSPLLGSAKALAHELRHMEQHVKTGFSNERWCGTYRDVKDNILFTRLKESDARAFENTFETAVACMDSGHSAPDFKALMRDNFKVEVSDLYVGYDEMEVLSFATKLAKTEEPAYQKTPTFKEMQKIFEVSDKTGETYFPTLTEKDLHDMLWDPVTNPIRDLVDLTNEFQNKSEKGMSSKEKRNELWRITDTADINRHARGY